MDYGQKRRGRELNHVENHLHHFSTIIIVISMIISYGSSDSDGSRMHSGGYYGGGYYGGSGYSGGHK